MAYLWERYVEARERISLQRLARWFPHLYEAREEGNSCDTGECGDDGWVERYVAA